MMCDLNYAVQAEMPDENDGFTCVYIVKPLPTHTGNDAQGRQRIHLLCLYEQLQSFAKKIRNTNNLCKFKTFVGVPRVVKCHT